MSQIFVLDALLDALLDSQNRPLSKHHYISQFYGTAKVHKEFSNGFISFRPVNSQCDNLSAIASKYVDYYLQLLIPFILSDVINGKEVIRKLKSIKGLSSNNVWRSTSDSYSMYANIDPEVGLIQYRNM